MTHPPDPEHDALESELGDMFDRTAKAPSEIEHARLLGRAENIAKQQGSRKSRLQLAWGGALAAAAAVVFLALAPEKPKPHPPTPAPVASLAARDMPRSVPSTPTASATPAPEAPSTDLDEDDPVAMVFGTDSDDGDGLDLGPLFAPNDPDRRQTWLESTEEVSHGTP
jgi:hypothetical protein